MSAEQLSRLVVNSQRIARNFHEAYERLAPAYGYKTREASAVPWEDVPKANRDLMVATVSDLLSRGHIRAPSTTLTQEDWDAA